MTTCVWVCRQSCIDVVEAYRLGKYDNLNFPHGLRRFPVWRGGSNVEAYRLGKYDNLTLVVVYLHHSNVVEAYRLGKYDNRWYRLRSDLMTIGH